MMQTASALKASDELVTLGDALDKAVNGVRESLQWILAKAAEDRTVAGAASVNYLMQLGWVCGGWMMGRSALRADQLLAAGQGDRNFLEAKKVTARFYMEHLLPRAGASLQAIRSGPESMMTLSPEQF
jgi:hypothetical protein